MPSMQRSGKFPLSPMGPGVFIAILPGIHLLFLPRLGSARHHRLTGPSSKAVGYLEDSYPEAEPLLRGAGHETV